MPSVPIVYAGQSTWKAAGPVAGYGFVRVQFGVGVVVVVVVVVVMVVDVMVVVVVVVVVVVAVVVVPPNKKPERIEAVQVQHAKMHSQRQKGTSDTE